MTLYENLYRTYKILQNDGHGTTNTENYRLALANYRASNKFLRLNHILKNLHDSYTAGK